MAKRCLILGSASTVWQEVEATKRLGLTFDHVVACKEAGVYYAGNLDAWVSLHPERFVNDIATRSALGYPAARRTYGYLKTNSDKVSVAGEVPSHWTAYKFDGQVRSGSSGLFACKVALIDLGFEKLVLCGIPLDKEAGRIDGKVRWNGATSFKQGFAEAMPFLKDTARSMSGWTQSQLGTPSRDWLNS